MSERAKYWEGLVSAWERSGLTQAEFCRRHDVKAVSFGWWKRRLRGTSGRTGKPAPARSGIRSNGKRAAFVEVGLSGRMLGAGSGNALPSAGYEVVLPHGVVVRVPNDFDADQVTGLLRAVAAAC